MYLEQAGSALCLPGSKPLLSALSISSRGHLAKCLPVLLAEKGKWPGSLGMLPLPSITAFLQRVRLAVPWEKMPGLLICAHISGQKAVPGNIACWILGVPEQ